MIRRFLAVFHARNLEFLRDRASLSWNIVVPVFLVVGMAVIFSDGDRPRFKVAVLQAGEILDPAAHPFLGTRFVKFYVAQDQPAAIRAVGRHRVDMLVDLRAQPRYWVNPESPNGYLLERLLEGSGGQALEKQTVTGDRIRYVDWLLPGVLGMNIMFSCLFGVGFVVVRYRKSGFLKRLYATPLRPVEFLLAQVVSRLSLILVVTSLVYLGTSLLIGFRMAGSHWLLLLTTLLGATSMISLGLTVAARVSSEELAGGLLNFISWPMMLLSGVWFSMDGTPEWLQLVARLLPLTHLLEAARSIMLDGAGAADVAENLVVLALMSAVFLAAGAWLFRWNPD